MEFTKLGGSDDPVEGSNVSFICLLFWGGKSNSKNQVKWSFIKTESKEPVPLNDYVLPGGLKKNLLRRRERLYDYIPFIQGMEIRDEVQRHILKLFEVPLNIPTTIRCSSWDDLYHQDISFKVKGDEGKT